jgi:chromosome segregation ATPase
MELEAKVKTLSSENSVLKHQLSEANQKLETQSQSMDTVSESSTKSTMDINYYKAKCKKLEEEAKIRKATKKDDVLNYVKLEEEKEKLMKVINSKNEKIQILQNIIDHKESVLSNKNRIIDMKKAKQKTQLCIHWTKTGCCSRGDSCWFAHGEEELIR